MADNNTESMKDFEKELESSFKVIKEGDILDVTVIGISETELTVDLNYYTEGIIPLEECSDDPSFSIKNDCNIGDTIRAMVIDAEGDNGAVILSKKAAHNLLVWDELKKDMADRTVFAFKVTEANPGGVTGFVKGVKAFIPASKIGLDYVEDTESYVGMTLNAIIITADANEKRLVLSAKEIARENAVLEHSQKISKLAVGETVSGKIVRMESYGVFIESQITNKFIKSPKEVVKLGDTVSAKIIALDGDRISLSMKALENDIPDEEEDTYEIPDEFRADKEEKADESPFAKLLKGIKL